MDEISKIKEMLKDLCAMPSVSGYEHMSNGLLVEKYGKYFDKSYIDSFGNSVFFKKSAKKDVPVIQIDAHFDEIGFMVTKIEDGGFLRVCNIGGIDTGILPASEVTIYGKKAIYGVICSTPPHLQTAESAKNVPKMEEILIDTGYSKEELEKIVSVGDVCEYKFEFLELENSCVLSKSLDDKACVCACLYALINIDASLLNFDVYLTVSAQEETGKCGARLVSYDINPDFAIITDVNFALGDGIKKSESIECGKGASVDISALSSRDFSRNILKNAKENALPCQVICEPDSTGTNNELVMISGKGVKTAVMSIPLKAMHTSCEVVSLNDVKSLVDILTLTLYTEAEKL
jgi:endoglucanase